MDLGESIYLWWSHQIKLINGKRNFILILKRSAVALGENPVEPDYLNPTAYLPPLQTAEQKQRGRAGWSHQHLLPFVQCVLWPRWKEKNKNIAHPGVQWIGLSRFFSLSLSVLLFSPTPVLFYTHSPGYNSSVWSWLSGLAPCPCTRD